MLWKLITKTNHVHCRTTLDTGVMCEEL